MPPIIHDTTEIPSHVALCQELIQRNNVAQQHAAAAATNAVVLPPVFTKFVVHESVSLCRDYSHPHTALMQIISSSIVAYVGKRFGLDYQHKCHRSLDVHSEDLPFDVTTIQNIFPQALMPVNQQLISLGQVAHSLCQSCIQEYTQGLGKYDDRQKAHHCLAFPALANVHLDTIRTETFNADSNMPEIVMKQDIIDADGHLVRTGLGAVLPLVKNRLYHASLDWSSRSDIPGHDPRSGAVIYLDANASVGVPFWVFKEFIPKEATLGTPVTHVSILSGSDCAQGKLRSAWGDDISCLQYGFGKCC